MWAGPVIAKRLARGIDSMKRHNPLQIYRFIVDYKAQHDGNSPTIRQIQRACGVNSTSVVVSLLDNLELQGLIRRPRNGTDKSRNIEVVGGAWSCVKVMPQFLPRLPHGLVERMMDFFKQNKAASAGEIAQALREDVELIDLALRRRKEFVRTENDLWSTWS